MIEVRNISKRFGDFRALDDVSHRRRERLADRAARPVGLGQVDPAPHHRGARAARRGRDQARRRGRDAADAAEARRRLRLPALRRVQAHDGARQHRVRPQDPQAAEGRGDASASTSCSTSCSCRASATGTRRSSPAASGSAWRSPARSRPSRRCCCSTSRSARSTRACARSCASGCGGCTRRRTRRPCSSRTTRRRRWRSPTRWS